MIAQLRQVSWALPCWAMIVLPAGALSIAADVRELQTPVDWAGARAAASQQNIFGAVQFPPEIAHAVRSAPVPVRLPPEFLPGMLMQQFTMGGGSGSVSFKATPYGYVAVQRGTTYDVVIEATNRTLDVGDPIPNRILPVFSQEDAGGGAVSFRDFGASYRVEFHCNKHIDALHRGCITEDVALALVSRMVIVGGEGMAG
ncbi:hypothetical protein IVA98_08000 [Bradyrhizobium sp. 160]|uniref:hypothetical protein n=1 Tax=Bradyrhizobium sp. 160 TaxID=2782634 RepID=UPI001FF711D4|nr:hypothetical protein [Bradyrhizobium sp. 160]MCK1623186.1 hypothetical protein [Bradyrhizobium sp. 160]